MDLRIHLHYPAEGLEPIPTFGSKKISNLITHNVAAWVGRSGCCVMEAERSVGTKPPTGESFQRLGIKARVFRAIHKAEAETDLGSSFIGGFPQCWLTLTVLRDL